MGPACGPCRAPPLPHHHQPIGRLGSSGARSPSELRAHRMNVDGSRMKAMTAEELAGAAGTTKAQILAYENGHRVPDPPRIKALARALHIHPRLLMNPEKRGNWAIADVRRGCGLRADDVVRELGVSPKERRSAAQLSTPSTCKSASGRSAGSSQRSPLRPTTSSTRRS
ncbi:helix-turn-helix transcriptional regulator [Streptomyces sp. NBC_01280]|uniref:helix-turn-helix domain-containing protein n=1 Tax=Streptomyces sp. NBC_01280 TaxID=2903810 RepID=UPI002E2EBE48|nr:helix-turn-helix transcriptional regulator [Streptomyces sp. NBC_01280]WSE11906.1 helix-turn-helix transcriptional regulator [Streptomyces sp. NBC_01397]WSE19720.1 helix-turn-helix transcriptional regulator [Streptomyces sp. NBC_01397]